MRVLEGPLVLFAAVVLDRLLLDPSRGHPVRLIGRLGDWGFRCLSGLGYLGGLLTFLLTLAVLEIVVLGSIYFLPFLAVIWLSYFLALGSLLREVSGVFRALEGGDLELARKRLGFLVSRDTRKLSEREIVRGALETLSENFNDAFVGPIVWYVVGGFPLLVFYKVAETLDSMFGYRHEPFAKFGFFPARIDDLLNFIPARLSVLFMALAAPLLRLSGKRAIVSAFRDGGKHPSPNAGYPQAALAGALGIALGGPTFYHGRLEPRAYLSSPLREIQKGDIRLAIRLVEFSALAGLLILGGLEVWLWRSGFRNLMEAFTSWLLGA